MSSRSAVSVLPTCTGPLTTGEPVAARFPATGVAVAVVSVAPTLFVARSSTVYSTPFVRPVIVHDVSVTALGMQLLTSSLPRYAVAT